ncbi:MAG: DUF1501 domain-containing protein [Chloroflexota bacterium]|nr:DUF1501 domain-containing protein [Dehalococcoidia bacterium]MDW8254051.1 DUF1501 domain-containing protein [Chloroflexota bacterium]
MLPFSRRDVLKGGASLVSIGLTAPAFLTRTAEFVEAATSPLAARRILVVMQWSGGNDGLNTIVPIGYPAYYAARPRLAIPAAATLPLTATLGWHPSLAKVKARYEQRQVAIIQNVGYPNPNRSHFRSMDIWHTAEPDRPASQGWLGSYLANCCSGTGVPASEPEVKAWSVGSTLPLALWVRHVIVPTISSVASFSFQTDGAAPPAERTLRTTTLKSILESATTTSPRAYEALTRTIFKDAMTTAEKLQAIAGSYTPKETFPSRGFGPPLRTVCQLIRADLGARIFYVQSGGFDTHANQVAASGGVPVPTAGAHADLLANFADSVEAFLRELEHLGRLQDVVILTFSEFGRRLHDNDSLGTDHGAAAPLFVIGAPVKGGLYGTDPDFTALDQSRDIRFQIDFRSVYATIIRDWLGGDPVAVLGGTFAPVPFLA